MDTLKINVWQPWLIESSKYFGECDKLTDQCVRIWKTTSQKNVFQIVFLKHWYGLVFFFNLRMILKIQILLPYLCGLVLSINGKESNYVQDGTLEFIILHNNDMHARFEQTSVSGGKCSEDMKNSNKCYGGFARVAYE